MSTPTTLSHFFLILLLLFIEITSKFNPSAAASHDSSVLSKPRGVVLNLIHRSNSVLSPYYNPNATQWDLTREAKAASLARARSYSKINAAWKNGGAVYTNGGVPVLSGPSGGLLLAKIYVGTPPIEQFVMIDTGSSLTWIQCEPCTNCPKPAAALFNPLRSSTYSFFPCKGADGSNICERRGQCDNSQTRCLFKAGYLGLPSVAGYYAKETFVFGDSSVVIDAFGCAHLLDGDGKETRDRESGILGLGWVPTTSIIYRFNLRFSHCFGNLSDPNYQYHKLFLGDEANLDAPSTPIVSLLYGRYYVGLEEISFNKVKLAIDPNVFKLDPATNEGGTVFDSGSTQTFLKKAAYDPLEIAAGAFLDMFHERVPVVVGSGLCYKGTVDQVVSPSVTLHFNGGLELELEGRSLFQQEGENVFCWSFYASEDFMGNHAVNIIGVLAQQSYNIGFDINAMKVYFRWADCKDL